MKSLPVVVDQAISAASNFVLMALLMRSSSTEVFGRYMVVYAVYLFFIQVYQAVVAESMLVVGVRQARQKWAALWIAAAAGLPMGFIMAGLFAAQGASHTLVVAMAVAGPLLLVNEACRQLFVAIKRAWSAVVIDAGWLAAVGVAAVAQWMTTAGAAFLAWVVAGAAFAVCGVALLMRQAHAAGDALPETVQVGQNLAAWRGAYAANAKGYAAENVVLAACTNGLVMGLAAVATVEATGAFRAIQTIFGPLSLVLMALRFAGLAKWGGQQHQRSALRRISWQMAGLLATGAVVYAVIVALVPDSLGMMVFGGDNWPAAANLIVPMGAVKTLVAVTAALMVTVRLLNEVRLTASIRIGLGVGQLCFGLLGGALHGAFGVIVGLFCVEVVGCAVLAWQLMRRQPPGVGEFDEAGAVPAKP